jgi:uncharacterized protein
MAPLFDHPNLRRDGHWDAGARLADMDADGVAAELIWHFSQNGENLPWVGIGLGNVYSHQLELGAVAYDIYNRWLADFCAADPERLLGLVYIPSWDIDASIETLRWARDRGLRCVNFPAPGRPSVKEYNHWDWDPFWSTCTELGFALSTHSSGGPHFDFFGGPGGMQIVAYEGGSFMSRRAAWILTFGLVFERHPELKLVCVEADAGWVPHFMYRMDHAYDRHRYWLTAGALTRMPSEYFREHVYTTFQDDWVAFQVKDLCNIHRLLWANDFPHSDSTWPCSQELLAKHAAHLSAAELRLILHDNVAELYGLAGA